MFLNADWDAVASHVSHFCRSLSKEKKKKSHTDGTPAAASEHAVQGDILSVEFCLFKFYCVFQHNMAMVAATCSHPKLCDSLSDVT